MNQQFRSLRVRMLVPLLVVSLAAALSVAIVSYVLGDRWARRQINDRFEGIALTLSSAAFPLNERVVQSLAELTDTDMITLDAAANVMESSIDVPLRSMSQEQMNPAANQSGSRLHGMTIGDRLYRVGIVQKNRAASAGDRTHRVVVLFDESRLTSAHRRAAIPPLVTGLSTVFLLTSATLWMASRLINRLSRLQQQVDRIAAGDFDTDIAPETNDEVGLLASAVRGMSTQLKQMWQQLHRQEGQRLLHQVAGGLAHQLRNGLTGARMAVELHHKHCQNPSDESLGVALAELEQTEDYVRRLLLVAAGKQDADRPASVGECISDIRSSLNTTARHRRVALSWIVDASLETHRVTDGPGFSAALTNLILNAMQAGERVEVIVSIVDPDQLRVDVIDDGPGPPDGIAGELFEPFVTSKPEGLGLGLPLVARSAERLGGRVEWGREDHRTRFTMFAQLISHE